MKSFLLLPLPLAVFLLTGCPRGNESAAPGKSGGMPPAPVFVTTAVKKDMPFEVRTFGNVEPIASVAVKAQVGGELIRVHFKEGEEVEAKKLLFTIQPRLYDTQKAQAEANLERDRALAANAVLALKRQEALDQKGSGVKEELEKARTLVASTAATVKADEALLLIAETQVGYTTVEAPMAGLTGTIRYREGNLIKVTDEEPLTTIVQMAPIYVSFALPEQHLDAIRKGYHGPDKDSDLSVTVRDSRDGRTLAKGLVVFIANSVDPTTGTITLKASFDNKDRALWPGAFVDVSARLGLNKDAVVVPSSAVMVGQSGTQVLIVNADNTAATRPVKVLRNEGQEAVIEEGLAAGETVISSGQSRVLPGGKVIPRPLESAQSPEPSKGGEPPKPPESVPAKTAPAGKPGAWVPSSRPPGTVIAATTVTQASGLPCRSASSLPRYNAQPSTEADPEALS